MFSHADIIRSLVNKNCTDDSIMSTALSPDCTPRRIMEKLAEAERFDLALDVSMKLGLDVLPLWKTWAMRCLKNRNFVGAREKFRHCFVRLKSPGISRSSVATKSLLKEILKELSRLESTKLPLSEEIESIKQRSHNVPGTDNSSSYISAKPDIYSECIHYLEQYGDIEEHIKFYVDNSIWGLATRSLVKNRHRINADKFFINEVLLYSATIGQLDQLVLALLQEDPSIDQSLKYFRSIYAFFEAHKRHNSLYYIQSTIGDSIAAAEMQITHFFLRKPTLSYKELNYRLTNLNNARKNYQDYIDNHSQRVKSSLFKEIPIDEVKAQLDTVDLQIRITRNFSINEVTGCIHSPNIVAHTLIDECSEARPVEKDDTSMSPVTLFDKCERRLTYLASLVLIYFNSNCSSYLSESGNKLAHTIIQDFNLDKLRVFKTAMRIIIDDESCDTLENASLLLKRIEDDTIEANAQKRRDASHNVARQRAIGNHVSDEAQPSLVKVEVNSSARRNDSAQTPVGALYKRRNNQPASKIVPDCKYPTKRAFAGPKDCQNSSPQLEISEVVRELCDEVVRDSISNCQDPDYKMELSKLLSTEAKFQLYIELSELSNAQMLAFKTNRTDYVARIIEEAERLNQTHVKTVCELWIAKH